ncbi:TonB-dependent receptor plug domain-containing protein [Pseudomonas bharatica]|uniref:TonB-dependent receptor plug domain-containing protein n=1 Tax=Pseudomonas bharatica TaxID=2692112 RepID=UPI001F04BF22|nr:TonB-dependent receptor plug domain-containing protein [Pseudomonas bharatica]
MSFFITPPKPMRLKPLAWSILLALFSSTALAEDESPARQSSTPNMEPLEIELPAGYEEKTGNQPQELQAQEITAEEWEEKDDKGRSDVYRKDVSNVYAGKDDIERYKGANAADLFKGMNGVYSGEARNSGALDPNIRGIQGEGRIPVTVDGTEQATSVWLGSAGVSNRNYVDPNMIGSISVEKGPSMTPGVKSGIGGSVEIRTLDAEDIVRPGESYGLEIKTETASNAVAPNEDGMNNLGRDYRDIEGPTSRASTSISPTVAERCTPPTSLPVPTISTSRTTPSVSRRRPARRTSICWPPTATARKATTTAASRAASATRPRAGTTRPRRRK